MRGTRQRQSTTGMVVIELPRGVVLVLTPAEYLHGLGRGKIYKRAERHQARQDRQQAKAEAQRLAWLKE